MGKIYSDVMQRSFRTHTVLCFSKLHGENKAVAIVETCAAFSNTNGLMSNGATHFKNEVILQNTHTPFVAHRFIIRYCPWSYGAIEWLGKELTQVQTFGDFLSKQQWRLKDWVDLWPAVQSIIIASP